jgi:hypothetical protein
MMYVQPVQNGLGNEDDDDGDTEEELVEGQLACLLHAGLVLLWLLALWFLLWWRGQSKPARSLAHWILLKQNEAVDGYRHLGGGFLLVAVRLCLGHP